MMPRFIDPIETEYDKKFPNSKATLFFDYENSEKWLNLLKKAIEKNEPLKKEDIISYWGEKDFKKYLEELEEVYDISKEEILKGL